MAGSSLVRLSPAPLGESDLLAETPPQNSDDFPTVITTGLAPAPPALVPGTKLGNFELMESIGTGGMATVQKARDVDLGRIVALKILPPSTARDSEAVARFRLEARAAAKLDHENIARVYFCGEDAGLHFIAFEFVEGENLRQVIDRVGRIAPELAISYLQQLSAGLGHAAERGVVHRDMKPSNILITPDGRAKIVDMGLARHLEGQSVNGGVTQSGVTLGTFDYISPEQALDPRRADIRSDIYSLGCAFYHALTGRPPVPEGTAAKKLQAHQHDQPTDPRDLNPAVGDGLAMVLARMMAKRPEQRYQSPAELSADLAKLVAGPLSTGSVPIALTRPDTSSPVSVAWLAALAVIAIVTVLFWNWSGQGPTNATAPWQEPPSKKAELPSAATVAKSAPAPAAVPTRIADARGIADTLAKQGDRAAIQLRPGAVFDLTTLTDGLVFSGTSLVIEPDLDGTERSDSPRPILRIAAVAPNEGEPSRPGSLSVRNTERLVLRGIELQIVERAAAEFADDDPIGLLCQNVGRIEIENCLIRAGAESRKSRIVGVAVNRENRATAGSLSVRRSLVDLGPQSIGLRIVERTEAELTDVGFGPHLSAILWSDDPTDPQPTAELKPSLAVQSSTFVFDRSGAALSVAARAVGGVLFTGCVFAEATASVDERPTMPGMDLRPNTPTVLRIEDGADPTRFSVLEGSIANAVYRVVPPAGLTRFHVLAAPPWNGPDPRPLLALAQPWDALQLNLNERRLRVSGVPYVLGMTHTQQLDRSTRPIYEGGWPPGRPQFVVVAKKNQRVVHPEAVPDDATDRLYPTVAKAFEDLKPGETLLIAQNGPVTVAALPERSLRATIAAYDGYAPVLEATDEAVRRPDSSLFPLADGELTFIGLQIRLKGRPAVVTMAGGTSCTFRNCVVSLDEKDDETQSVVLLTEPTREMKMTPGEPTSPRIRFENSFVFGRGKAVVLRTPRAFEWTAENTAFALEGPVLFADAATRDGAPARATVRWKNVTAVSLGHQWELRGSTNRSLGLDMSCDRCLLASASRRRERPSMIQLGNGDGTSDPATILAWRTDGPTIYGNFDLFVEIQSGTADRPMDWDADRWIRTTGESGRVVPVRFAATITAAKLRKMKPDDLKAETESADFGTWRAAETGADLAKLPKPAEEKSR